MMFYLMAHAKISRAHFRARQICAQPPVLRKITKYDIFGVSIMARSARESVRAPKKLSDSKTSITIDAF